MARNKRKNRFYPCPKCGHKTILARSCVDDFEPDDEPYEPDVRESIEDNIAANVLVAIHYCGRCYEVADAWIEDPYDNGYGKVCEALDRAKKQIAQLKAKLAKHGKAKE